MLQLHDHKNLSMGANMTQVLYAMLDQKCHSATPPAPGGGTTELLAELHAGHSVIPHEPGTAWQARFGHLVNYGASYYSYLFARSVAATLWQDMFIETPLDRSAGRACAQTCCSMVAWTQLAPCSG